MCRTKLRSSLQHFRGLQLLTRSFGLALAIVLMNLPAHVGAADVYPTKPIRFIVGPGAGPKPTP